MSVEGIQMPIEQDTADGEELSMADILLLVQPSIEILENIRQYSVSINRNTFDGWVKQPSPCCAAAVVAGAFNSLMRLPRSSSVALTHNHILAIYKNILTHNLQSKQKSFERRLGTSVDDFLAQVTDEMKSEGKQIGGKKDQAVTKKAIERVVKKLLVQYFKSLSSESSSESRACAKAATDTESPRNECFDLFLALLESEGFRIDQSINVNDACVYESESDVSDSDDESESCASKMLTANELACATKSSKFKSSKKEKSTWKWAKDLLYIYKQKGGITKLTSDKPSTAPIGNWGIIQSMRKISEYLNLGSSGLEARLFMGKATSSKSKIDHVVSTNDSEMKIQRQWDALRSALNQSDSVLIFHLTNHYALIYASREWLFIEQTTALSTEESSINPSSTTANGVLCDVCIPQIIVPQNCRQERKDKVVRQILTARRGQRPTAWIDFDEVRSILLGWSGYKIILCQRNSEIIECRDIMEGILADELA